MPTGKKRTIIVIGCLIAATCFTMSHAGSKNGNGASPVSSSPVSGGGQVSISGQLIRDRVFSGGDGNVALALTLAAGRAREPGVAGTRHVDMVIVLDRSGSMQGQKIADARRAVVALLSNLTEGDRFALVSYSDHVRGHGPLSNVTGNVRNRLSAVAEGIAAGGGTNLAAGLSAGIDTLLAAPGSGNAGRVILISDGRANQGITDPYALAQIASSAARRECVVSTVGVGSDFNELLMTSLADHGTGSYHYLENPIALAGVFESEFRAARAVVAEGVEVGVPLPQGVTLVHAAGYPVSVRGKTAFFYPGALLSGQSRKIFLTLRVPVGKKRVYEFGGIRVRYRSGGRSQAAVMAAPLTVACVDDPAEAEASIDRSAWEEKVLQADYNRLKEEVADDIRKGDGKKAMGRIESYREQKASRNRVVGSAKVKENLENDLGALKDTVEETFSGAPAAVSIKRKKNAKALQYEGYRGKREAR